MKLRASILCTASTLMLAGCYAQNPTTSEVGYSGVPGRLPAAATRRSESKTARSEAPRRASPSARQPRTPWPGPALAQRATTPPSPGLAQAAPAPSPGPTAEVRKGGGRASPYARIPTTTASGDAFNPDFYTAAHPTLPFGARLRVVHGGKSVVVRVNDRPSASASRRGVVLELTPRSAREIGLGRRGQVTFEPVD